MTTLPIPPDPKALLKQLQLTQAANRYSYLRREAAAKLLLKATNSA